ncbi:MAG: hypothetical protein Q8M94_19130, partial [Ignavibacteria bacterium]|nr:hypothetical protein [Ignavibacteria bacterium]
MKKILFIGPEVTDFVNPLAKNLKALGYTVDLMENRKIPRISKDISESYSNIINYNEITGKKITLLMALRHLFKFEFYKKLFSTIFFNHLDDTGSFIKSVRNSISYQNSREIFSDLFDKYDILNLHSLSPGNLALVDFKKSHNKIILSFWGSDLFQIWGVNDHLTGSLKDYFIQLNSLKRCDVITVHSYEMEKIVTAKYGPGMQDKMVRTFFGIKDEVFDLIDKNKLAVSYSDFQKKYGIPENKIRISIGYSSNPICNHLLILDELEKIEPLCKEKIHLLMPMTYGMMPEGYMEQVTSKLNRTNISYTIFDKYLSLDEIIKFRIISDIMIMMNKSDALSASVSETLYCENLLISALWLPYSPYRKENIFFYESDFPQLKDKVTYAIDNY